MAAPTRRARRRVTAVFTIPIVIGVIAVSALPSYGFAAAPSAPVAAASAQEQQAVAPVASAETLAAGAARDGFTSLSVQQQREERATSYRAAMAEVSRFVGDDYPFKDLGAGGLSPLNYALANCTDFVAWRLNRDAGSTEGPWLMPWSYLTPNGGNAYQWASNWEAHGWIVSAVPVVGAVAWFSGLDHVAYVAKVNGNSTVLVEEYNNNVRYTYDTRTISVGAATYLYPPPLPGTGNQ